MTKPVSRKMAVDALLWRFYESGIADMSGDELHCVLECAICEKVLKPGDRIEFDHVHADVFDGPHEFQNLRPLHKDCHKKKTARDIKDNAKIDRLTGVTKTRPRRKMKSANRFPPKGSVKFRRKQP